MSDKHPHRKDLSWSHFDDEPRVQEKHQVKDQQYCIFVFPACLLIPSRSQRNQSKCKNKYSINGLMIDLLSYRAASGEKNFKERIKTPNFWEAVLAVEIMSELQQNLEEKVNPSILKDNFSSRTDPSIFTSIEPVSLDQSNKTS